MKFNARPPTPMNRRGSLRLASLIAIPALFTGAAGAALADDAYLAGYAAAVLQREFKLDASDMSVKNGVITLPAERLAGADAPKVVTALSSIPGVSGVRTPGSADLPASAVSKAYSDTAETATQTAGLAISPTGLLPPGHLFKPLLADPRWPHFSAAYHYYTDGGFDGANVATVGFGETIPIYRGNLGADPRDGQWEMGVQAGVFSDFNLDAPSSDLINTDFFVAGFGSLRLGDWSTFTRVFHQSSHLGDEFLLRTKLKRVNLSYEGADVKLSYELPYGLRVYGGGGGLFHREPETLKPWSTQYGFEFRSPWRMDVASMRPIAAIDVKNYEENDWDTDLSARVGVRFDNLSVLGRNLDVMAEYFNGHSPSGQFYNEKIEYVGLGANFHF